MSRCIALSPSKGAYPAYICLKKAISLSFAGLQKAASRSGKVQLDDELLGIDGTRINDKIPSLVRLAKRH